MKHRLAIGAIALGSALCSAHASATGAWNTYIRTYSYSDLLAEGDTVWCATGEAGLLRFRPSDSSFVTIAREPSGLASNHVSRMVRDRSGRLWVGTLGAGVSRLSADGKTWDLVNRFDGLPSDSVTALAALNDTVFIGTTRGLALWNGSFITGALPDGFNPSPFASDYVTGFVAFGDTLWVSTTLGVYRSHLSTRLTTWTLETNNIPPFPFIGLVTDGVTMCAVTLGGTPFVRRFAPGPWQAKFTDIDGASIGGALRVYEDHHRILLATDLGLYAWTGSDWQIASLAFPSDPRNPRRIFAFTVDPVTNLFYAADQDGLYEQPATPGPWRLHTPPTPPGNNVLNVNIHRGRVYVTTFEEGIGRFDGREWRVWPFGPRCTVGCDTTLLAPNYPFALLVDGQGKKWFGCWGETIDVLDDNVSPPSATHFLYPTPPTNNDLHTRAWASTADSLGGRWFGMDTDDFGNPERAPLGLEYYNPLGVYAANYSPENSAMRMGKVHGLTTDRTGRVWVGYTGAGIDYFLWPPNSGSVPEFQTVTGTERLDIEGLVAHGDTLWALATSEVRAFRTVTSPPAEIASYPIPAAPGQLAANPLAVARDGTVWVGTVNGIRVIHPGGLTQDYNVKNSPLADDEIRAIRIDPATGAVWIGTTGGLNRFDPGYRPPPAPSVPRLEFKIYPNPSSLSALGVSLRLEGNAATFDGAIYDVQGRRLRRFSGITSRGLVWDGRTERGELVGPGIYFIRVESGGKSSVSRVALLR
jgi:hypothetical protein